MSVKAGEGWGRPRVCPRRPSPDQPVGIRGPPGDGASSLLRPHLHTDLKGPGAWKPEGGHGSCASLHTPSPYLS